MSDDFDDFWGEKLADEDETAVIKPNDSEPTQRIDTEREPTEPIDVGGLEEQVPEFVMGAPAAMAPPTMQEPSLPPERIDPPMERVVFEPRAVPIRTEPPPEPPRKTTLGKRRFLTLAAFAEALIPPGGAIPESAKDVGVVERIDTAAASFDPAVRNRLSKLLWLWEWMSVFTRAFRPFSRLPAPVAVGVVERASKSKFVLRRQAFSFLKILCLNQWASTAPVEEAIGFTYSCLSKEPPQDAVRLEVLGNSDVTHDHIEECDVVIVGSGAGGSVMAKELAEVGLSVVVLEEGSLFTRSDFAGPPWERFQRFYRAQGTTVALGRPTIPLPMGKAVGGTTLVNSGTCFRTPDRVLERWASEFGIEGIDPESMRPYFERVEKILHVKPVPEELFGKNARVFMRGAESLGLQGAPLNRNINGCRGCGTCAFGCPSDAKQATHLNYLPKAQRHGASIYANCRAQAVLVEDGRARGIQARMFDPRTYAPGARLTVKSKVVVLAAGAVHTPALLQRNALATRSGQTGRNLRIHPAAGIGAFFEEDVYSWRGTLQPYYLDDWHASHDLMIEVTSITPGVGAGSFPGTGAYTKNLVAHAKNFAGAGVFVSDTSTGRVRAVGSGEPVVTYALNKTDTRKLVRGITHVAEVFLAAGAQTVFTGLPGAGTVSSRADLEKVREEAVRPGSLRLTAFHPGGTARMGADPSSTVVDPFGECHEIGGLFIADASVFPGCPTVNPMISIMALATRTADHLVRRGASYF
ncbi:MAG: GMC family oxidoreductase N-terminal domain-containing protein [Actinomycetota bacterium]|nr:GMC family oxidoreductase N-terminal domain-containing protein [Actinomycetota bacterium]